MLIIPPPEESLSLDDGFELPLLVVAALVLLVLVVMKTFQLFLYP